MREYFKRFPIIRHIRAVKAAINVMRWAWFWGRLGIGNGEPVDSDVEEIRRIWRGER